MGEQVEKSSVSVAAIVDSFRKEFDGIDTGGHCYQMADDVQRIARERISRIDTNILRENWRDIYLGMVGVVRNGARKEREKTDQYELAVANAFLEVLGNLVSPTAGTDGAEVTVAQTASETKHAIRDDHESDLGYR